MDDDLKIVVAAELEADEEKSLQNIEATIARLERKLSLRIPATLDKKASRQNLKTELQSIKNLYVKTTAKLSKADSRKALKTDLAALKGQKIELTPTLDKSALTKQVKDANARIDVNTNGADGLNGVANGMDSINRRSAATVASVSLLHRALNGLEQAAQKVINTVTELDGKLTELRMVTGDSYDEASALVGSYNALAKELGSTTGQVIDAANEWLRQGKSTAETTELINQSMILSKVGAMDSATATQRLTSALNGYKLAVEDAASVVDKLTAVDMEAAVSADGIAEALSHTASSANLAGVELDKIIAYLTVVQETTQKSASVIGESFKSIFSRMGKVTNGEAIDDFGKDISQVEATLRDLGIELRESETEFRNFDEILDDVGKKWDTYSTVVQRQIATAFGGVYQSENFLALMNNYEKVAQYVDVAANSAGTAAEKFSAYQESIAAHYNTMVAAAESLATNTVSADFVNALLDAGTVLLEFVDNAELLKIALAALGTAGAVKGITFLGSKIKDVSNQVASLTTAFDILGRATDGKLAADQFDTLLDATKGLSAAQMRLIVSQKTLTNEQRMQLLVSSGLTKEQAAQTLATLGLASAESAATTATFSLSGAFKALTAAIAANPIGFIITALTTVISVVSIVKNKIEEARQKMVEVADAAKDEADSIKELYDEYVEANRAYQDNTGAKDDLTSATDSLLEKLGYEKGEISDLIEEYGTLEKAIDGVTRKSLEAKAASILEGYDAAKKSALSDAEASMGWFSGSTIAVRTNGDDKKFAELLQKAGYLGSGDLPLLSTPLYTGISNHGDFDSLAEGYEKLLEIKEALESGIGTAYTADELANADVYTGIVAKINAVSDAIEKVSDYTKEYNDIQAQLAYMDLVEINGVPETQEQFDALKQSLLDTAYASGKYLGSQDDIESSIINTLAAMPALQEFVETPTDVAEGVSAYKAKLSSLTEALSELRSFYSALEAAESDMAGGGGLSADTIEALAEAEENYLDYLYEENGVVKLNTEAWKANANAKMLGEMDEIQKEIDSLEEQNAVLQESVQHYKEQRAIGDDGGIWTNLIAEATAEIKENNKAIAEAQGQLAIYSSIFGTITGDLDAYSAALQSLSDVTNTIDAKTSSFQTLADLQAQVANDFTMSLEKALEFAKVYPEIMNNAQMAADGQITLNKDVVDSFIRGKKDELDAQIDTEIKKLEAKRSVFQAELDIVNAQIAEALEGDAETLKSANETAAAQMSIRQAVLSAAEQAGIDETTANQMALAAMTEDWDTFRSLAEEAVYELDDESAFAFTSIMGNFATMSQSIVDNTNEIIGAYSRMGLALENAMKGVGTDRYDADITSGSVSGGGKKSVDNLISGMFEDAKSDYADGGTRYSDEIDEWQKTLQEITDSYAEAGVDLEALCDEQSLLEDAILSIDGQIAALDALKNAPLESFQSDAGSSSSKKEVEEYLATIDQYREAVEALRKAQGEAESLESQIENAGSYEKKIALQERLIEAYKAEQDALHALNNARDATINEGVDSLRALGFAVEYNADTNELWIENLEHLNELTADSKGEYDTLQEATNALREGTEDLIDTITDLNESNREGSATWWELRRSIIETTISMYENAVQAKENAAMLAENGMNNAIDTKNLADVKRYAAEIIAEYQNIQQTIHEEAEYYRSLGYSDTSDEVSELSDLWWDYADNIKEVKQQVVDYLIDIVDAAHESVDEIQNVSETLYAAADELAANGGWITVDTYQAIQKLGTQYMQMLEDENGVLQINEERINAVIAARTQQLAVENAMAYVERIKLATQEGSIEDLNNLVFATNNATSSTWGLVYAELELMYIMGDLNDSQYQAALHNIQAMQALAENAVANIGKTTGAAETALENTKNELQDLLDELEEMQDGAGDLVDYVMDMLKHRMEQQIDLLEEMKDKYGELIDLKKESLDAAKDEEDYQKDIADKIKEMAKLQERINALSLDDSRESKAEQAALLEELAGLQEDLADAQAEKAIETQKDSLDQMQEDYEAEKDAEIKILEESISSTQKLYDMAIEYIRNNWDALYSELIAWNTEYGTDLNSEITSAWEAAEAAAQRYGDFVTAIMSGISAEIESITQQINSIDTQTSSMSSGAGSGGGSTNTTVGNKTTQTTPSNEDMVKAIVSRMKELGAMWSASNDKATNDALHQQAVALANQLDQYGVHAEYRSSDGTWWITKDELNPGNVGRLLHNCYHTGGFIGDEPLKPNEQYVKAENGELVLTANQQDTLAAQIERIGAMAEVFQDAVMSAPAFSVGGGLSTAERNTINNITNNSRPIEVSFGDTIINGAKPDAVKQHIKVTEDMVNQIARLIGAKW